MDDKNLQNQSLLSAHMLQNPLLMNIHGYMPPQPQFYPPMTQPAAFPSALPVTENISSEDEDNVKVEKEAEAASLGNENSEQSGANLNGKSFEPDLDVVSPAAPVTLAAIEPKPAGQKQIGVCKENFVAYYYHFIHTYHASGLNKHCSVK